MKKILYTFLLLSQLSQTSWAFDLYRMDSGRIALLEDTCEKATALTKSLDQWTKNSHENKNCPVNSQSPIQVEGKCGYDITNCVPNQVVEFLGTTPKSNGPNCWNLALVMKNILPALRYSSAEEMNFYMTSPLCRQLNDGEEKIPGDVGAIRQASYTGPAEYHGFIYVSEDVAYSKNGFDKHNPYSLMPLDDVFKIYQVDESKDCRKNELSLECGTGTAYFRCMSMEEYLKTHQTPKKVITAMKDVDKFDRCLQGNTFTSRPLTSEAKKSLVDSLNVISNYLFDETEADQKSELSSEENKFLLGSLNLRISSIISQLDGNNDRPFATAISGFNEHLQILTYELQGINIVREYDETTKQLRYRVK